MRCEAVGLDRSYAAPGPTHSTARRPSPGSIVIRCGTAVTLAHTSPADARPIIVRQFVTQNHSGSPTSPAFRRGGAVRTRGAGIGNRAHSVIARSAGDALEALFSPWTGRQTWMLSPTVLHS